DPPWEMGLPAPPLVEVMGRLSVPSRGTALVPGCGYGNEVILLGEKGWDVTAVDFAPAVRISEQGSHSFRSKVATQFGAKWPPVSV
ncbi:MAG: hypothetical protein QF565_19260, partial [Arenicellales bacterium]|nr:hypothetical protein [Arenicellales bacterium]